MQIKLSNIIPKPLTGREGIKNSEVWGKELELSAGAAIHVVAPSGSGKSTFLGVVAGERTDHDGKVSFSGEILDSSTLADLRSNKVSFVFQDLRLIASASALENIQLKNELTVFKTKDEIFDMAHRLGVNHVLHQPAVSLSRGESQRVAIIRSLCMPFKWLIMDEPFSHLDEDNERKAIDLIKDELKFNSAGLILLNVNEDRYFEYDLKLKL